jgi:multidrug transporter EmrE-like cation transporter
MIFKESPAIVFAGMNILGRVIGVVSGVVLFKEKLTYLPWIGLFRNKRCCV